ncbi:MAG: methanogenesis marker 16 metalloprotein [Promethearchaeota archaeon]|nr:MAG: methanogenesis marker 16 metalloprotein [Candidatus Lokiarchaeota archaeon]
MLGFQIKLGFLVINKRKLSEIRKKIEKGSAVVITVQELIDRINDGEKVKFEDVDIVTTATKALMSGIMGIFSFRLSPPKTLRKFTEVQINGIPTFPGPCPNEYLGIVDLIIYGTAQSQTIENYCGGSLFREMVEGKSVNISAKSAEGETIEKEMKLEDMQFAKLMGTRQAIKNYNAMINCESYQVDTIFSCLPFEPNKSELTFSGCGALNPFQNDPEFESLGVGLPILVNGNIGHLIGPGTRNYIAKPNMMTMAPMQGMKPEYMGAFKTSYGLEPICSIAIPIPILNENIFNNIVKSDKEVPLTILSLVGREKVGEITYGDVWDNNFLMKFNPDACENCEECKAIDKCPTNAFIVKNGLITAIDRSRCFNCGNCTHLCPEAFNLDLNKINFEGSELPIVLRQSDRYGAIKLAEQLKSMILKGDFPLRKPISKLQFAEEVK